MIRGVVLAVFILFFRLSGAQTTNTADTDSLFKVFPNPAVDKFYVTTLGKVYYAMIISSTGSKRVEFTQFQIPSFPNQFGLGCIQAGCVGAFVQSNYICSLQRNNLEPGLYYLVLLDELGHVYHTIIVFQ